MGQVASPVTPSIILTATDRLVAANADGGLSPLASHVILFGESAGRNLGALSNVILLGFNAGAGGLASAGASGTVVIGGQSLAALSASGANGPMTIVGFNNFPLVTTNTFSRVQALGDNIATALVGGGTSSDSILIGSNVVGRLGAGNGGTAAVQDSVIIGTNAARGSAGGDARNITANVIIGYQAAENWGVSSGGQLDASVIIGRNAGRTLAQSNLATGNVMLGDSAGNQITQGSRNVCIGSGATGTGAINDNVMIGQGTGGGATNGDRNTLIGGNISRALATRNICIGFQVTDDTSAFTTDLLAVGTYDGATRRMMFYGDLATGNLIIGRSVQGTDRDLAGTNSLKLLNGTTGAAPVGGGRFFVTAGELSWHSSANVQYTLTPHASRGVFTVATLPAANLVQGQKAYVTDALAPAFAAVVAAGGAVVTPVYYDGAAWRCG